MRFNGGSVPYTPIGLEGWPRFGYEKNNRWQFSNDLTWVKGRHTIKTGFEFRHHSFPSRGWGQGAAAGNFTFNRLNTGGYDAAGNNLQATGDPFASFLLGQVFDSNQNLYVQPTFRETYTALWANDEFKVSDKLTLTLGMRFDYQAARTEVDDRYSTFDPNTPNPGAAGTPGRSSSRVTARAVRGGASSRTSRRMRGARAPGLRIGSATRTRSAAGTASITRTCRSASSAGSRRRGSRRIRSHRT